MEIWTRLIEGQNLKLRCRCFATFFCGDAMFVIFFRGVAVWTVPQCPPLYYTLNPCGTVKQTCYAPKTTSFNIVRFEHEKEMRRKALKEKKNLESSPFWNPESTELESGIQYSESGIHRVESRIQDCHGFPYMGRKK